MADNTKVYKKLTNASGFIRLMSLIAFILSALGIAIEPLGKLIYNMIFKNDTNSLVVSGAVAFFNAFQHSIIICTVSLMLVIAAFSSKRKKNIGQGFSAALVLVPLAASVYPTISMIEFLSEGAFKSYMNGADNIKFRGISILLVYLVPLCAALILMLCGVILSIKAMGEKAVEVVYVPKKQKQQLSAPLNNGFNNGFAPMNAPVQPQGFERPQVIDDKPLENLADRQTFAPEITQEKKPFADEPKAPEPQEPPKERVCVQCGASLADNAKFCKKCGHPV